MISVLLSVQPKWCKLICSGEKTVEVRKNRPNCELPFKCYIYCTKGKPTFSQSAFCDEVSNGKVIGEFVCDRIDNIGKRGCDNNFDYCYLSLNVFGNDDIEVEITDIKRSCIAKHELNDYGKNSPCLYGWHITDLVVYDEPRELKEFKRPCDGNCQECKFALWQTNTFISESRIVGCAQKIKAPQSWCYVMEEGT